MVKGSAKKRVSKVFFRKKRSPVRAQDPEIQLAIKEGDLQSVGSGGVSMTVWDAMNQSLETKSAQVIGHLCGRIS